MYTTPYNLHSHTGNPVQFYDDLRDFTDLVLSKGSKAMESYLIEFRQFTEQNQIRTYQKQELLMELLMAGIFWKNYSPFLSIDALFYQPVFNTLYQWRKKFKHMKPRIDKLRANLAFRYLTKKRNREIEIYKRFEYLNSWLNCSKEFIQETDRLNNWKIFLESKPVNYHQQFWSDVDQFADWFILESVIHLSEYTKDWDEFMMDSYADFQKREDFIFCTRKPSEYHLNMVAAEVMNRTLKPNFDKAKHKILLLPTCMVKSANCNAELVDGNLTCQFCNSDCNVAKLSHQMNKQGVRTVLIPHSTGFSKYLKPWENSKDTALIGVACVLNLITGGYEMQKLNIPSQCVFLDACGCKKHWLRGEPTQLNQAQLNKLIIHEKSKQPAHSSC